MFLRAAESYGVTKTDIFQTVDLFEGKITNQQELFFTVTIERENTAQVLFLVFPWPLLM